MCTSSAGLDKGMVNNAAVPLAQIWTDLLVWHQKASPILIKATGRNCKKGDKKLKQHKRACSLCTSSAGHDVELSKLSRSLRPRQGPIWWPGIRKPAQSFSKLLGGTAIKGGQEVEATKKGL